MLLLKTCNESHNLNGNLVDDVAWKVEQYHYSNKKGLLIFGLILYGLRSYHISSELKIFLDRRTIVECKGKFLVKRYISSWSFQITLISLIFGTYIVFIWKTMCDYSAIRSGIRRILSQRHKSRCSKKLISWTFCKKYILNRSKMDWDMIFWIFHVLASLFSIFVARE